MKEFVKDPQKSSLNRILLGIHVVYEYTSCTQNLHRPQFFFVRFSLIRAPIWLPFGPMDSLSSLLRCHNLKMHRDNSNRPRIWLQSGDRTTNGHFARNFNKSI
ncbi:hypothetical protein LINPERPRIM_LOCUS17542 [Linum perenne]